MKKLFGIFVLAISTLSLSGCFIGVEDFDWQDIVSGKTFYYTGVLSYREYYIEFSRSGEYYETGEVGTGRYNGYSFIDEAYHRDSYTVYFRSRNISEEDVFRIYEDGSVYFKNIDVEWRNSATKEQIESLSTNNMILLTPQ